MPLKLDAHVETLLQVSRVGATLALRRIFAALVSDSSVSLFNWTSLVIYTITAYARDGVWRFVPVGFYTRHVIRGSFTSRNHVCSRRYISSRRPHVFLPGFACFCRGCSFTVRGGALRNGLAARLCAEKFISLPICFVQRATRHKLSLASSWVTGSLDRSACRAATLAMITFRENKRAGWR